MYEVWGEGGGTIPWGGVATRDTEPYIYIYKLYKILIFFLLTSFESVIVCNCSETERTQVTAFLHLTVLVLYVALR